MRRGLWLLAAAAPLLAGIVPAPQAQATTTVSSEGGVTTIKVPIDFTLVGTDHVSDYHKDRFADFEKMVERFWWGAAFEDMPYRDCVTFKLDLDIQVLPDSAEGDAALRLDPPAHQIAWWDDPTVDSFVFANDDREYTEDSPGSFTGFHQGQFGDLDIGGFVHELGHLMGLGDDYIRVPDDSEQGWHAEPKQGREGTLMGPRSGEHYVFSGRVGKIDQALIDRIGDMLAEAGEQLPECWSGAMHSEATQSGDGFECASAWEGAVDFTVDQEGAVSGDGHVDLVSGPECSFGYTGSPITFYDFAIHGRRDDGRFALQLELVDYNPGDDAGGWITGHFVPHEKGTPERQEFVVPITRPGVVEERVSLQWNIPGSGGEVIDTFDLTCEICQGRSR